MEIPSILESTSSDDIRIAIWSIAIQDIVRDFVRNFVNVNSFQYTDDFGGGSMSCPPGLIGDDVAEPYGDDMPGMTIEEFQKWSNEIIKEVKGE